VRESERGREGERWVEREQHRETEKDREREREHNQAKECRELDTHADGVLITSESMKSAQQEKPKIPSIPDIDVPTTVARPEGRPLPCWKDQGDKGANSPETVTPYVN